MKKIATLMACGCIMTGALLAQPNITRVEYFFNTDPGFGNGMPITVSPNGNLQDISAAIPVNSLSYGLNTFYIRSANAGNVWSITNKLLFLKATLPPTVSLAKAEYFIDSDPGFGMATAISASGTNAQDISMPVNVASLSMALHTLYIRSMDVSGKWSITNNFLFLKTALPAAAALSKAEYFIDADPGFGNGADVTGVSGTNAADITAGVNVAPYSEGLHTLYIRSTDANGKWSITNNFLFYKTSAPLYNITEAEYFIDADPGFGAGKKINITPAANIDSFALSVDVSSLDTGRHRFALRSKNSAGKRSITNYLEFRKDAALPVTLISFEAIALNNQSLLEWKTAGEQNASYFEVEYSLDGIHFQKLQRVDAKGNSSLASTYTFLHTGPSQNGVNYYRIKQVDRDGNFTYLPIRTVKFKMTRLFVVSPNPVQNGFTIYTPEKDLTVHIFETSGKKIRSMLLQNYATPVNAANLPKGMYYVVAERNGQIIYSNKIVKL